MITNPKVGQRVIVRYTSDGTPLSGGEYLAEDWYRRLGTLGVIIRIPRNPSDSTLTVEYTTSAGNRVAFSTNRKRLDYFEQLPGMCRASADL